MAVTDISTFDGLFKAADGLEAVNVVGKNGYLLIDIIAYKRDIPPFNLEIINGQLSSACCHLLLPLVRNGSPFLQMTESLAKSNGSTSKSNMASSIGKRMTTPLF